MDSGVETMGFLSCQDDVLRKDPVALALDQISGDFAEIVDRLIS